MRIIGGKLKGKKISFTKSLITRPLKDSVKESIFNVLAHSTKVNVRVENSKVLDLYSGVGSFGFECISRGAQKVTFVESNKSTFQILASNVRRLNISDKVKAFNLKIENMLKMEDKQKYNIFFFDPPFLDDNYLNSLLLIKERKNFELKHLIIIHRERKSKDIFNNCLKILMTKEYGRSKIFFGTFNLEN